jgi:hypothetical protein
VHRHCLTARQNDAYLGSLSVTPPKKFEQDIHIDSVNRRIRAPDSQGCNLETLPLKSRFKSQFKSFKFPLHKRTLYYTRGFSQPSAREQIRRVLEHGRIRRLLRQPQLNPEKTNPGDP